MYRESNVIKGNHINEFSNDSLSRSSPEYINEGVLIEEEDERILRMVGPVLRETILKQDEKEPFRTFIFLDSGARLLNSFTQGLISDIDVKRNKRFLQVERVPDSKSRSMIEERIRSIINDCEPPYLIIDDAISAKYKTYNLVKTLFEKLLSEKLEHPVRFEDYCLLFAFIGVNGYRAESLDDIKMVYPDYEAEPEVIKRSRPYIELPEDWYEDLPGVKIGTRAHLPYFSFTRDFIREDELNNQKLKGVKKNMSAHYPEKVSGRGFLSSRISSFSGRKVGRRPSFNIRQTLKALGKDLIRS